MFFDVYNNIKLGDHCAPNEINTQAIDDILFPIITDRDNDYIFDETENVVSRWLCEDNIELKLSGTRIVPLHKNFLQDNLLELFDRCSLTYHNILYTSQITPNVIKYCQEEFKKCNLYFHKIMHTGNINFAVAEKLGYLIKNKKEKYGIYIRDCKAILKIVVI